MLLRSNQVPVIVLLWSPRSDVCLQLADSLSGLAAADNGKWSLVSVNVDVGTPGSADLRCRSGAHRCGIGCRTTAFQFPRRAAPDQLRRWVDSLLSATAGKLSGATDFDEPEEVDPALALARQQLEDGDFAAAADSYQAILDANPNDAEAKGAVRQIAFLTRATAQRPDVVAVADAAPDDIEAAFAAADVQILSQDVRGAFDRLVALVRRTSGDERTSVRTRLIELFELFDPADPKSSRGDGISRTLCISRPPRLFGSSHSADIGGNASTADAGDHATDRRTRRHHRGCRSRFRCNRWHRC